MRYWIAAFLAVMIGAGSASAATINGFDPVPFPLPDSGNPTTADHNYWIQFPTGADYRITPQQAAAPFSGSSAPTSPFIYQLWWDTSLTPKALKVYTGTTWVIIGNEDTSGNLWSAPIGGGAAPSITAASTTDLCPTMIPTVVVTGSTGITSFGATCPQGTIKVVKFSGTPTITYNASTMILAPASNLTLAAGDIALFEALGGGSWRLDAYLPASGVVSLNSPAFTGTPTAPTAAATDSSTTLATTAFVQDLQQLNPQGRLTLVSGSPVMLVDVTGAGTVYYTPYAGFKVPIYNGTHWINYTISELAVGLTAAHQPSGSAYDIYVFSNSGTPTLCVGPAWTNVTTRGAAAAIVRGATGLWTNALALTATCFNNTTSYTVASLQGTYVGSMYANGAGTVDMAMNPTAASGGTNNFLGIYNAYNRLPTAAISQDSTASWTYNSGTYAALNASNSNRVNFIDGLGQSIVHAILHYTASTVGNYAGGAVDFDSTSATPQLVAKAAAVSPTTANAEAYFVPALGVHYVQAIQQTGGGTGTYAGSPYEGLRVEIGN